MGRAIVNIGISEAATQEELEQTLKTIEEIKAEILRLLERVYGVKG